MIVEVNDLKKKYSNSFLLEIESLKISKGEHVAIIGANGSGKSTFLKLILDLLEVDSGYVELFGKRTRFNEDWKEKTGAFIDDTFLIDFLTVREYLLFLKSQWGHEGVEDLISELNFSSIKLNQLIRNLSSGNRKKIGIVGALINNPDLLIFDEMSNFLDIPSQNGIINYLHSKSNTTILFAEHNLNFIKKLANRVLVFSEGSIIDDIPYDVSVDKNLLDEYIEDML